MAHPEVLVQAESMGTRQAKVWIVGSCVLILSGFGFIFTASETWWVPTVIGLFNLALFTTIYVNARKRERHQDV